LLKRYVEQGHLGIKSGKGFYSDYEADPVNAMDGIIEGFEGSEIALLQTSGSSLGIQQGRYGGNHGLGYQGLALAAGSAVVFA
jgi:hypothetical protein